MKTIRLIAILTTVALVSSCDQQVKLNTLTKKEKAQGWELLFDGLTTNGWHNWNENVISGWVVEDSSLVGQGLDSSVALMTDGRFSGATYGFMLPPSLLITYCFIHCRCIIVRPAADRKAEKDAVCNALQPSREAGVISHLCVYVIQNEFMLSLQSL